jgi:3-isopropylmalate dehydratase small subunit
LIEWENGEATANSISTHAANNLAAIGEVIAKDLAIDSIIPRSYIETKTRHILQPLLFIKNNWLSSVSVSLFWDYCFRCRKITT